MAIMLSEDQYGTDASRIGFPGLISCMGLVVLLNDGSLVAAHVVLPDLEPLLLQKVGSKVTRNGSGIDTLYGLADVARHTATGCLDITGKANALGYSGMAYLADLSHGGRPQHGIYAELTSKGAGNVPAVRFAWHDRMDFAEQQGVHHKVVKMLAQGAVVGKTLEFKADAAPRAGEALSTPFMKPVRIP